MPLLSINSVKQITDYLNIFPIQIVAKICNRNQSTANSVSFLNMYTIFEIDIFYALKIELTLNVEMKHSPLTLYLNSFDQDN